MSVPEPGSSPSGRSARSTPTDSCSGAHHGTKPTGQPPSGKATEPGHLNTSKAGVAATAGPHGPGVRYLCQRCTACCRWPGDVILSETDISRISRFLGLTEWDFIQRHTRLSRNRRHLSLHEAGDGACAFLDGDDCRLQPVKPEQCAGFPNRWVFPGWRQVCEAVPVAVAAAAGPRPAVVMDSPAPGASPQPPQPRG